MADRLVVADSGCLIALARIEQLDLLQNLFDEVVVPEAVWAEVTQARPEASGAAQIRAQTWLRVADAPADVTRSLALMVDLGEAEAIALAAANPGCLLLVDDSRARRLAKRLGISLTGTLGVLRRAKDRGMIPAVGPLLRRLEAEGIYIGAKLAEAVLKSVGE